MSENSAFATALLIYPTVSAAPACKVVAWRRCEEATALLFAEPRRAAEPEPTVSAGRLNRNRLSAPYRPARWWRGDGAPDLPNCQRRAGLQGGDVATAGT